MQHAETGSVALPLADSTRASLLEVISDHLVAMGLLMTCLLTGYYLLHLVHLPNWWPALVAFLVGIATCYFMRYQTASGLTSSHSVTSRPWVTFLLVAMLVVPPMVRAGRIAWKYGGHSESTHFRTADEAYDLMIARGWQYGSPPPDLAYAGCSIRYHYGVPLLVEFMNRSVGIPFHWSFYIILPVTLKVLAIASLLRIFRLIFPRWSQNRCLLATILTQGCFVLDPYNIVWNAYCALKGAASFETIWVHMPVASALSSPIIEDAIGGSAVALCFLLLLLANLDRCPPLGMGCALFAVYLTKQQVFLPVAGAWLCMGLWAFWRERKLGWMAGFATAAGLVMLSMWCMPVSASLHLSPQFNDYLVDFGRRPCPLAPALLSRPLLALSVVFIGFLLGTHFWGVACSNVLIRGWKQLSPWATKFVVFSLIYLAGSVTLLTCTQLTFEESVRVRFDEIYGCIGDDVWLSKDRYRIDMMNVSLVVAMAALPALCGIFFVGTTLELHRVTPRRRLRSGLAAFFVVLGLVVAHRWCQACDCGGSQSESVVPGLAVETLAELVTRPGIVLTNDMLFPGEVHGSLLNVWAPQLFGQQFWASNFRFGTFAYSDSYERLRIQQWFWSSEPTEEHRRFLRDNRITYLFIRKDVPFSPNLRKVMWLSNALENDDYLILESIDIGSPPPSARVET